MSETAVRETPVNGTLRTDTLVTEGVRAEPGWIRVEGGVVRAVGAGTPDGPAHDLGARVVVPGFVDMHVHGGGGGTYTDRDAELAHTAVRSHRAHGTTTSLASLVSAAPDQLLDGVRMLADLVDERIISGVHLEGPWLSPDRAGAHDPRQLRDPDPTEIDALFRAGGSAIAMVTLAPERAGGLDAIRRICGYGAVAAVGHTEATYEQTQAAVRAGARVATHLYNAMRPVHHREPGPVVALLEDERVTLEMIVDGAHLHPALYRRVGAVAADRIALVTDAMAAAGMPDGDYRLGSLDVVVDGCVARLAGTDTIAGSTATMDQVFATAVGASAQPRSEALVAASRQTSAIPADALGLTGVGRLRPGSPADLVVLDPDLRVEAVMKDGQWVAGPPAQ